MDFEVKIIFKVDSPNVLEKQFKFEYHKTRDSICTDKIIIENRQIKIIGNRSKSIDIVECWKTKKSNYKRAIVSSLFYIFNFYKRPLKIVSMTITAGYKTENIEFSQEFNKGLQEDFQISEKHMEKLFSPISYKHFSNVLLNVLYSQVLYSNSHDFYYAYRSFNSVYTYIYSHRKKFEEKIPNRNKKADLDAIKAILWDDELIDCSKRSINLSHKFIQHKTEEMYKLLLSWFYNQDISSESFSGVIGYDKGYENYDVLDLIKRVADNLYPDLDLKKFSSKYERQNRADETKKNCLQLIILYANYYRNKILHGEYMDSRFLISDVNVQVFNSISDIVFQLSIDLLEQWNYEDFIDEKLEVKELST